MKLRYVFFGKMNTNDKKNISDILDHSKALVFITIIIVVYLSFLPIVLLDIYPTYINTNANIESLQTTVDWQKVFLVVTLILAHIKYLLELNKFLKIHNEFVSKD